MCSANLDCPGRLSLVAIALVAILLSLPAQAEIHTSSDISADPQGEFVGDEDVLIETLSGGTELADLGSLPQSTSIEAYHQAAPGTNLFVVANTISLPGGATAEPRDVVQFDGAIYVLIFDGSAQGLPTGAAIDAVSRVESTGDLLLSFDTSVLAGGLLVADEDLARFDGAQFFLAFDGSAAGVSSALDLDAAHYVEADDEYLLSFDGSGTLSGFAFADEDLLAYQPSSTSWSFFYDGSVEDPDWIRSDLDAVFVPEPTRALLLLTGVGWLATMRIARKTTRRSL